MTRAEQILEKFGDLMPHLQAIGKKLQDTAKAQEYVKKHSAKADRIFKGDHPDTPGERIKRAGGYAAAGAVGGAAALVAKKARDRRRAKRNK